MLIGTGGPGSNSSAYDQLAVSYGRRTVKNTKTAVSGDSYQASTANMGKIHYLTPLVDILYEFGTGASVTITDGIPLYKGQELPFTPVPNLETVSWKPIAGGSFAASLSVVISLASPP